MSGQPRGSWDSGRAYHFGPRPLGSGAQGSVWPATVDGIPVAIKVARSAPEARRSLEQEVAILGDLRGIDGVVPLLDRGEVDGCPALVMPLYECDAGAYAEELRGRDDALSQILRFAARVARVLRALHSAELANGRVLHRDIKPENILVEAGQPRLVDFGGSLVADDEAVRRAVFGSPLWAPFDQVLPEVTEANPTWDTYALCVVLFWWLTGTRPRYQARPAPILTDTGLEIWRALCEVAAKHDASRSELLAAHKRLAAVRAGSQGHDLVDVRGVGAIQAEDRAVLRKAIGDLGRNLGTEATERCLRQLEALLARGLSPLSHPSPPNRYWQASELAADLDAIADDLDRSHRELVERAGLQQRLSHLEQNQLPPTAIAIGGGDVSIQPNRARPPAMGLLVGALLLAMLSIPLLLALRRSAQTGSTLAVDDTADQAAFAVDRSVRGVGATLAQAQAFCAKAGGTLPTQAQWDRASSQASWWRGGLQTSTPWEWTAPEGNDGSATLRVTDVRDCAGARRVESVDTASDDIGFRCVYPAEPPPR